MSRAQDRSLLRATRQMAELGLVIGSVGNVSARIASDRVRITPTRVAYSELARRDLVTVFLTGEVTAGQRGPSRETPLHLAVYRARPEVHAVVHTHSPHATAWSFLGRPLGPATEEMSYFGIGPVRTSVPAPAGSEALGAAAVAALGSSGAVLLGEHGVLSVGRTVDEALVVAQAVEHQAQVGWLLDGKRELRVATPRLRPASSAAAYR